MRRRVLLAHPGIYSGHNPYSFPPWGVLCVASRLRALGDEVEVVDLNGLTIAEVLTGRMIDFAPDVVGLTGKLGHAAARLSECIATVRSVRSEAKIAVGGPLVASYPSFDHSLWNGVDALFWGDGEDAFAEWLAAGAPSQAFGGPSEADLEIAGIPTWWDQTAEYVLDARYWPGMGVPSLHVSAARGCTRRCTFCYLNQQYPGRRFRYLSARRLIEGLDQLSERFGARGFYFVDDCFIDVPPTRTNEFCALMVAAGAPYRFGCDLQIQELEDHELLGKMYAAGFRNFYVGVEAASAAVRRRLGKGQPVADISDILNAALDLGFQLRASIGIGWPGETEADMVGTLELIDSVPRMAFDAFRYLPLPGVPLTSYWIRRAPSGSTRAVDYAPTTDYSEYGANYSDVADATFDALWHEMRKRETARLSEYYGAGPGAT